MLHRSLVHHTLVPHDRYYTALIKHACACIKRPHPTAATHKTLRRLVNEAEERGYREEIQGAE